MIKAVLKGDEHTSHWCRVSWKDHFLSFQKESVFTVWYENLNADSQKEAKRILNHLGLERSGAQIAEAIEKQSFSRQKSKQYKDAYEQKLLRKGKSGYWEQELTAKQQSMFDPLLDTMTHSPKPT